MSDADRHVSYAPTDGLCYDPSEARYWDESALQKEVNRAFDICHGCRMCFKYCDAFPKLFAIADERHGGNARTLDAAETDAVMDACFQCKLCEVQCPYTPRDEHAFQLDFPKLVHRFKAVRGKRRGFSLRDRVLGNPDAAGKLARASFGLANVMNRVSAHRWFLEKVIGIDRRKERDDLRRRTRGHGEHLPPENGRDAARQKGQNVGGAENAVHEKRAVRREAGSVEAAPLAKLAVRTRCVPKDDPKALLPSRPGPGPSRSRLLGQPARVRPGRGAVDRGAGAWRGPRRDARVPRLPGVDDPR